MKVIVNTDTIELYHAHIYYSQETLEEARALRELVGKTFGIELGRLHERPVGPHLPWSCQLTVPKNRFGEIIPWLALNRGNLDFFVHPETGNDLADHTKHVMWIGKSYDLKLDIFQS